VTDRAMTSDQVTQALAGLPGWRVEEGAIRRTYQTDGWRVTMLAVNAIAWICEAADHHADLAVSWPSVGVALSTHSAGGITAKDFEVARLIDAQLTWAPPEGSPLAGPDRPLVR
jgi:4a-hydroxytetrahydrobiopterin dehydratase